VLTLEWPRALAREIDRSCRVLEISALLREVVLPAVARGGLDPRRRPDVNLFRVLLDELRALPVRALHLPFPRDPRALRIAGGSSATRATRGPRALSCAGAARASAR